MLLTKKSSHAHQGTSAPVSPFVHSLRRGLSQALPTMDRRSFLRRSGLAAVDFTVKAGLNDFGFEADSALPHDQKEDEAEYYSAEMAGV